eukprot:154462_1
MSEEKRQVPNPFNASYASVPSESMDHEKHQQHLFPREFIMGGLKNYKLKKKNLYDGIKAIAISPHSMVTHGVILNRPPRNISFTVNEEGQQQLVGIRAVNVDGFNVGFIDLGKKSQALCSSNDNYLWFEEITMQNTIKLHPDAKLMVTNINFISFKGGEDGIVHEIGTWKEKKTGSEIEIESISEKGRLLLTGVLLSDFAVSALQFVDLGQNDVNNDNLLHVYRMTSHQGIHLIARNPRNDIPNNYQIWAALEDEQYLGGLIGIESDYVLEMIVKWTMYITRFISDPTTYILPDCLELLEKGLDGDFETMHSIFSMHRFFNHCIQTDFKSKGMKITETDFVCWNNWYKLFSPQQKQKYEPYLVKINKYFGALAFTMETCKGIIHYTPSLDIFMLCSLLTNNDSWMRKLYCYLSAIISFITQIFLFCMVTYSINWDNDGTWLNEEISPVISISAAIIITLIVLNLVYQQFANTMQFRKVFPGKAKYWANVLACIVNLGMSVLIVPLNFVVIIKSEELLDVVLNSLAILFILELDDQLVNINANDEKAVYLSYLQSRLMDRFNEIDIGYIEKIKHDNQAPLPIDRKTCEVQFN